MRYYSKAWWIKEVILTWQFIFILVLVLIILPVLCKNEFKVMNIKGAGFELALNQYAEKENLIENRTFKALKNLNEEELKIFLIMGGDDSKYYVFQNNRLTNEAALDVYNNLEKDSLLRAERLNVIPGRNDSTLIYPTEIGAKVHKILIRAIYNQTSDKTQ